MHEGPCKLLVAQVGIPSSTELPFDCGSIGDNDRVRVVLYYVEGIHSQMVLSVQNESLGK